MVVGRTGRELEGRTQCRKRRRCKETASSGWRGQFYLITERSVVSMLRDVGSSPRPIRVSSNPMLRFVDGFRVR
jgi:hypothetical protein